MIAHYFIGVDPGLSGAIGVLAPDGSYLAVADLPTVDMPGDGTVTRRLHGARLVRLLAELLPADAQATCYVEDVQMWGTNGQSSMAAMMGTKYVLLAVLDCFESRVLVRMVPPVVWKRHFGLKKPKTGGSSSQIAKAFKALSRQRAVGMFPTAPVRQSGHDGRAEALLIARYGFELWSKQCDDFFQILPSSPAVYAARALRGDSDSDIPFG